MQTLEEGKAIWREKFVAGTWSELLHEIHTIFAKCSPRS